MAGHVAWTAGLDEPDVMYLDRAAAEEAALDMGEELVEWSDSGCRVVEVNEYADWAARWKDPDPEPDPAEAEAEI